MLDKRDVLASLSAEDLRGALEERGHISELSFHPMGLICQEIIKRTSKSIIVFEAPQHIGRHSNCVAAYSSSVDALGLMAWCKNQIDTFGSIDAAESRYQRDAEAEDDQDDGYVDGV